MVKTEITIVDELNKFLVCPNIARLKMLFYEHYEQFNKWGVKRGETKTYSLLTGFNMYKSREALKKALDIFEKYKEEEVYNFLGMEK